MQNLRSLSILLLFVPVTVIVCVVLVRLSSMLPA
jgi:hypothetical protein